MAYGLVTDTKKYGTGSFYAPFDTSRSKALRIDPVNANNFGMAAGEDFYISVWIKYGTVNVSSLNTSYPIIKYGSQTDFFSGWELGLRISRIGDGNTALPYFSFVKDDTTGTATRITTTFTGSNGNLLQPTSGFDHWEVIRTNGVITFRFNGINSSNTSTTYNGRIGANVNNFATSSNNPAYKGIYVGSQQPFVVNQDNGAYIDQLFFARGVNAVQSTNIDGSNNDGALSTTVFLYNFNGNYLDTTGTTQTAGTTISSTSSVIVNAGKITKTSISLQPRFNISITPFVAPRIRTFSASLSSTFTQTAAGIVPVYGTGAFTSRFSIVPKQNANYPRPNGTWDSSIASQPTWVNFKDLYIDNVSNPTLGASSGTPGIANFNLSRTFTAPYGNNTPSDFGATYFGNYTMLGRIGYSNVSNNPWNVRIGIGYRSTVSTVTVSVISYSSNNSYSEVLLQVSYPNTFPATSRSLTFTKTRFGVTLTSNGVTATQPLTQVIDWQGNVITWATGSMSYIDGSPNTFAATQTLLDLGGQLRIEKDLDGYVYINDSQLMYGDQDFDLTYSRNGAVNLYTPGTTNSIASSQAISLSNPSYLVAPSGSNLLITRTGFNYATTVVSTNPYVVNDQSKILGLYNAIGSADNIGAQTNNPAQLTSAFTISPNATKAVRLTATITARATVVSLLGITKRVLAAFQPRFTSTINATKVHRTGAAVQSTTAVTVQAKQYKGTAVAVSSRFTATINAVKTSRPSANLTAFLTQVTTDIGTKRGQANLISAFTQTTANKRLRDNQIIATSTITQVTTAKKIVRTPVAITSQVTTAINGQRIRYASADLQVQAFELSTNRKDARAQANLTSTFALDANVYILQYSLTNVTSTFTAQIDARATKQFRSAIINPSQLTVNGGYVRGVTANLQVQAFELATGSKFTLEPRLQKIVEQETRIYLVKPEDRRLEIYSDGILKIKPETRLLPVKASDPVNTIPGIKL